MIEYGFYALAFLTPLFFTSLTFELFEFPKMILVYLLTILIGSSYLIKAIKSGCFGFSRTPLDKPIAALVLVNVLSTIFSIDRYTSIFGYYTRFSGGLLSLLAYVVLYYIFVWEIGRIREIRDRFIKLLLISAFFVSTYGILQHFGIDKDYWVQDVQRRVFSTLGQPNWLAAFLVMVIPVSLSLTLENVKSQNSNLKPTPQISKLFYTLFPVVLYTSFWFTYSRSGLLGFGAMLVTFLSLIGKENLRRNIKLLGIVFAAWAVISILTFTPTIAEKIPVAAASERGSKYDTSEPRSLSSPPSGSTIQIRLAVWKGTLSLIKDHWFLGTGPETFAYSFLPYRPVELNQTAEWEFLYNRAHNEYLNIAATTGLLGLGAYLWLVVKFVLLNVKNRAAPNNILQAGLFAGWVGALVTNFFGFSVVVTSLLFWLYMALNVSRCQGVKVSRKERESKAESLSGRKKLALIIVLLFTIYYSLFTTNLFLADVSFNLGEKARRYGLDETAVEYYQGAVSLNPREPRYHRELASVLSAMGKFAEAEREAEIAYQLNPRNSLTLRSLTSTYSQMSRKDQKYQGRAEDLAKEVIDQQPTNPQPYYQQALIFLAAEKNGEAAASLKKSLELKPDYQKARELLESFQ